MQVIRNIDRVLLGSSLTIAVAALMIIYLFDGQGHPDLWQRYAMFLSTGLVAFVGFCFVPLQVIERMSWQVYGLALVLLVLVFFFGDEYRGANRHFDLGVVDFHPANLMQWALVLALAWWFSSRENIGVRGVMAPLSLAVMPMVVLFVLPDIGAIILLVLIAMAMLFFAKQWRLLVTTLIGGSLFISLSWNFMHAYQKNRILTFFDSGSLVADYGQHFDSVFNYEAGYGLLQSSLAGIPSSIVITLVWLLIAVLIYRLFMVAYQAQSRFAFMLSATISLIFALYAMLNAAILSGYVHAVSIIRPLTAYNDLGLVFLMAAMGIVMRVAIETNKNRVDDDSDRAKE